MSTALAPVAPEKRNVPAKAMRLDAGKIAFQFADGDSPTNTAPIKMLGRSAEPISHWYWGEIVHDMAGFKTDHATVPIDWAHDDFYEDGIGFLDSFTADENGLHVAGKLVSVDPKDRASNLIKKAAAGVPYQASIFFRGERFEQIPEGFSATVNGYEIEGPAVIVREWALRGMAVCLYGADHRTQSQFTDADEVAVEIFSAGTSMPKAPTKPATPSAAPTELTADPAAAVLPTSTPTELTAPAVDPVAPVAPAAVATELADSTDPRVELKKFVSKFGAENGAKWFSDSVSYADALELHATELQTQLTAKDAEIEAANKKLASIDRGETEAAAFNDGDAPAESAQANEKFSHLGDNLSKFAGAIKLPNAK